MKRFKDCKIICVQGQSSYELLELVKQESGAKGYIVEVLSTISENDTLSIRVAYENLPVSRLILTTSEEAHGVSIVNIVPLSDYLKKITLQELSLLRPPYCR